MLQLMPRPVPPAAEGPEASPQQRRKETGGAAESLLLGRKRGCLWGSSEQRTELEHPEQDFAPSLFFPRQVKLQGVFKTSNVPWGEGGLPLHGHRKRGKLSRLFICSRNFLSDL